MFYPKIQFYVVSAVMYHVLICFQPVQSKFLKYISNNFKHIQFV